MYIHIGLPKSGSTTLQNLIYYHTSLNTISTRFFGDNHESSEAVSNFFQYVAQSTDDYDFDYAQKLFASIKEKYILNEKISLFSYERLSSVMFSNPNKKVKCLRLKNLFPESKIIILIRNQHDILKSQYRDYPSDPSDSTRGKTISLKKWIKLDSVREYPYVDSLNYLDLISMYEEFFGRENVHVFLFEDLIQDPVNFSKSISSILGVDSKLTQQALAGKHDNEGMSTLYFNLRSIQRELFPRLNGITEKSNYLRRMIYTIRKGKKKKIELDQDLEQMIRDKFGESNKALALDRNMALAKYSYPGF